MGIKPNKDVRLALSKAYYVCMTIADSTKERPMNDKEKNAVECRKKGSVLIKHLNEEFPDDPRVLEQFAKSSIFDKELQITIYEKLVKIGSKDANVHGELASLYLGKGKNNEGIAQYREAIMLGVDPRIVAHYLENLDTIFDEFGCPLEGLKELTRKIAFTDTPSFDAQPQVKEKFNVEFAQLKKQVIKKIDSNRCKKLSNK